MSAFNYQALDKDGKLVKGVLEGDSEKQIRAALRSRQLKPTRISASAHARKPDKGVLHNFLKRPVRLPAKELAILTRQLASLVRSGLPLDEALQITANQNRKEIVCSLLLQVRSRVTEGKTLAQAMSEHPHAFNRIYCSMVKAGESAGFLEEVLERLADYSEASQHARQKIRMAMIYPVALLSVSVVVVALLMSLVVPKLIAIFDNASRELPLLTRILIDVSHFMSSIWALVLLLLLLAAVAGFKLWLREPANRLSWHRLLLRLPLLGQVIVQSETARFAGTLSVLLNSGVPLVEALRIAAAVMSNQQLWRSASQLTTSVQEGESLARALFKASVFPPLMVQMAANGEANGTLGQQLGYSARSQERELEMTLGTTMALLEPLTIVLMGGLVTIIMLAILLPIFNINSLV